MYKDKKVQTESEKELHAIDDIQNWYHLKPWKKSLTEIHVIGFNHIQ